MPAVRHNEPQTRHSKSTSATPFDRAANRVAFTRRKRNFVGEKTGSPDSGDSLFRASGDLIYVTIDEEVSKVPLNYHHLRVLHAVAGTGTFSEAAERLAISQPAVSMQIRRLEEEMGLALVEFRGRQTYLTEAGRTLAGYAEKIFMLSEEAETALQKLKGVITGELLLGGSSTPGAYLLPGLIGDFSRRWPGVRVRLRIANTGDIGDDLLKRTLDLALVGAAPQSGDFEMKPVFPDQIVFVACPRHPLCNAAQVSWQQIAAEPMIMREHGSSTRRLLEQCIDERGLGPIKIAMELGSVEAIKKAVAAGLGIAAISRHAVAWEIECGWLHELPLHEPDLKRSIYLLQLKNRPLSPAAEAFIRLLEEKAKI